jgi:CheY-like chemotaxis protein/HPt (histidine-containing phosphotransfer) domain-containing protein
MLEHMGHRIDAVADGAEAVRAAKSIPYDLVLMDVMMPEMDGLTATRLIRSETGQVGRTPIIGLTANAEHSKEAVCKEAGMDGFVSKPVTADRLAAAIAAVVLRDSVTPTNGRVPPLLDERVLDRLADDIGADGAVDVVRLFLAEAPRMIERLERASISGGRTLVREVHTLASAARSVGLMRVGNTAGDIEQATATREPDAGELTDLLDQLHQSVARLAEWEASRAAAEIAVT